MLGVHVVQSIRTVARAKLRKKTPLPGADLAVTLAEYVRIACALLDVPVRGGSLVHALHALFALYVECAEHPGLAHITPPAAIG